MIVQISKTASSETEWYSLCDEDDETTQSIKICVTAMVESGEFRYEERITRAEGCNKGHRYPVLVTPFGETMDYYHSDEKYFPFSTDNSFVANLQEWFDSYDLPAGWVLTKRP
ncbi:MAG TPA: hypothetical protein VGG97_05770 [Bryobacteraceae bacterium]|jgi:lipopolysaccharide assembly outer membrane protein LptD (OstA)